MYRQLSNSVVEFLDQFEEYLLNIKNLLLVGDTNIDVMKSGNTVTNYKDIIGGCSF